MQRLQLDAAFTLAARTSDASRGTTPSCRARPTFEAWTTLRGARAVASTDLNALQLTVPTGTVHWLTGLQGDTADVPTDTAFTLAAADARDRRIARSRSAPPTAPPRASGAVVRDRRRRRRILRRADVVRRVVGSTFDRTGAGIGDQPSAWRRCRRLLQATVDGPHVSSASRPAAWRKPHGGAARRTSSTASAAAVRSLPLVTYNTWFAYGTEIDEASMRAEMERAAALGVELFVIDAGWYAGAGAAGPFDFDAGLGGMDRRSARGSRTAWRRCATTRTASD